MLYVYVQKIDVTRNFENFWKLNQASILDSGICAIGNMSMYLYTSALLVDGHLFMQSEGECVVHGNYTSFIKVIHISSISFLFVKN